MKPHFLSYKVQLYMTKRNRNLLKAIKGQQCFHLFPVKQNLSFSAL